MDAKLILNMLGIDPKQIIEQMAGQLGPGLVDVIKRFDSRMTALESDVKDIKTMLKAQSGALPSICQE